MSQPNLRVAIYPFEPGLEIRAQMLLAIEEIGHAGDINDQPGGPVLRGMRPIAAGPPAHLFKRRPFAHRIGVAHGQHWAKAAVAPFQLMSKDANVLILFLPRLCRCLAKPAAPGSGYRSSGSRRHGLPCPSGSASGNRLGPPRMRAERTAERFEADLFLPLDAPLAFHHPDLERFLVDPEMDLAPNPSFRAAMPARVPRAFALHLDAAAVDEQV